MSGSENNISSSDRISYNPLNWECTHKITTSRKYAATVLAISCIAILVAALMPYYPGVVYAYYTVFGLATSVSLMGLMVSFVKSNSAEPNSPDPFASSKAD